MSNMDKRKVSKICLVGDELSEDLDLGVAAQKFKIPIIREEENKIICGDFTGQISDGNILFVVKEFTGQVFEKLIECGKSVIGKPALIYIADNDKPLSLTTKPIYNYVCRKVKVVVAGTNEKLEVNRMVRLLRYMGGVCKEKIDFNVTTHVIAQKTGGSVYQYAVNYGIPVMSLQWIEHLWKNRMMPDFDPCAPHIIKEFRLKPFTGLFLSFVGFPEKELDELKELTLINGGEVVSIEDLRCTHFIVDALTGDDGVQFGLSKSIEKHHDAVFKEWFWASIQLQYRADERNKEHRFPVKGSKNFYSPKSPGFRKSVSINSLYLNVISPSNLDCSNSLDTSGFTAISKCQDEVAMPAPTLSKRQRIAMELRETEYNYVNVLKTIIKVFKEPLETPEIAEGLLDDVEMEIIFGYLPPILDVHCKVLESLDKLISDWKEDNLIGKIIVDNSKGFSTSYPPFVNYFEKSKEQLIECARKNPLFHAFLKRCESKPECARQTLQELMIRPVQRLPSIQLLLTDLLKSTVKDNPDNKWISEAIVKVKEALNKINEDKRQTEGRMAMFDIANDIKGCPPTLISANRTLISKLEVKLLIKNEDDEIVVFKGKTLTLLLFNDLIQICKKRSLKRAHSFNPKSPKSSIMNQNSASASKKTIKESMKHIEIIGLNEIKSITDIEEIENAFVIISKCTNNSFQRTFKTFPFLVEDNENTKDAFILQLNKQLKENLFQPGKSIDFEHANNLAHTLNKSKYGLMMPKSVQSMQNRASTLRRQSLSSSTHSLNVMPTFTPPSSLHPLSRRKSISRAISQVFTSPFHLFGSKSNLSASHRLGASLASLNENEDLVDGTFSLPTTPAPRKKKCLPSNVIPPCPETQL